MHPGEVVLKAMTRRRTKEELAAAKEAKAAKAAIVQVGLRRLAAIELKMEEKQENMLTKRVKAVRPQAPSKSSHRVNGKASKSFKLQEETVHTSKANEGIGAASEALLLLKGAGLAAAERPGDGGEIDAEAGKPEPATKRKVTNLKLTLRDSINQARNEMEKPRSNLKMACVDLDENGGQSFDTHTLLV